MSIPNASPALYNEDLAPATERKWGVFSIFNVWTSDVHSLWGYYLAASLFLLCGSFAYPASTCSRAVARTSRTSARSAPFVF